MKKLMPVFLLFPIPILAQPITPQIELSPPGGVGLEMYNTYTDEYWKSKSPDRPVTDVEAYTYTDYYPVDAERIINDTSVLKKLAWGEGGVLASEINAEYGTSFVYSQTDVDDLGESYSYPLFLSSEAGFAALSQIADLKPTIHSYQFDNPFQPIPKATQFWLYYTYNDWVNNHAGDWESVTFFSDDGGNPVKATYSTHYEATTYNAAALAGNKLSPKIYVSNGGHGSYGHKGNTNYGVVFNDNHKGDIRAGKDSITPIIKLLEKNGDVLSYSKPWGKDSIVPNHGAPYGPIYRTAKDKGKNPYKDCKGMEVKNIFGKSKELPHYKDKILTTSEYQQLKKQIIEYGPWLWSAAYPVRGEECRAVGIPEKITKLDLSDKGEQLTLAFDSNYSENNEIFGYGVAAYLQHKPDTTKKWQLFSNRGSCDEASCEITITKSSFGDELYGSEVCYDVVAWNPAGDSIPVSSCKKLGLALVIDDTGSMRSEIDHVLQQMKNAVYKSDELADMPLTHIVSFKDESYTDIVSNDTSELINTLDSIYASGGGGCEEAAGSGLLLAAQQIGESGKILIASDASMHDTHLAIEAQKLIGQKNIELVTMLSGTCDGSASRTSKPTAILYEVEKDFSIADNQAEPYAVHKINTTVYRSTFDGDDWEADSPTDASPLGIDETVHAFIGFSDKYKEDRSDFFKFYASSGKYQLFFNTNNASGMTVEIYSSEGDLLNTYGFNSEIRINSPDADVNYFIRVAYSGSIGEPKEYSIQTVNNPYIDMSGYQQFKQLTEDTGGKFHFVPEVKSGDTEVYEKVLKEFFTESLKISLIKFSPSAVEAESRPGVNVFYSFELALNNYIFTGNERVLLIHQETNTVYHANANGFGLLADNAIIVAMDDVDFLLGKYRLSIELDDKILIDEPDVLEVIKPKNIIFARSDVATTDQNIPIVIDVLANDTQKLAEELKVTNTTNPIGGSVTINADYTLTYTPDADFFGEAGFSYNVCVDSGVCATAEVAITVNEVPKCDLTIYRWGDNWGRAKVGQIYTYRWFLKDKFFYRLTAVRSNGTYGVFPIFQNQNKYFKFIGNDKNMLSCD